MINVLELVKNQSRMFNDPDIPTAATKPSVDTLANELGDAIETVSTLTYELRRVENRLVLIKARLEGLQVGL